MTLGYSSDGPIQSGSASPFTCSSKKDCPYAPSAVFAARKLNGEASGIRRGGFFRCVRAELIKLRHSAMWFAVFALPLIGVLIGTGNYFINADALTGDPWFDLWTQVALFFGYFFYPVLAAVVAGYLWRVEHFDHNWNGLMTTPVSASRSGWT